MTWPSSRTALRPSCGLATGMGGDPADRDIEAADAFRAVTILPPFARRLGDQHVFGLATQPLDDRAGGRAAISSSET